MKPSGLVCGVPIALPLLLLVSSWTMSRCLAVATSQSENESMANKIDEFVTSVLKCQPVPALTLSVVKDGQVVLTKGYGYNSANRTRNTTSQTRFGIGSLTKAFTALLLAKTARESKNFTLDTPISQFIPGFRLVDDYRSQYVTLRDLLSHRTAIPDFAIVEEFGIDPATTRKQFAKKLQYVRSSYSLREYFMYSNLIYALAGDILEKLHNGRTWEELLQETIFDPLNMTKSGTLENFKDFSDDFSLPCDVVNGTRVDVDPKLFSTAFFGAPAGTIYSNAEDMAKWMNFLLTSKPNASLVNSLFEPGMIVPWHAFLEMYKPLSRESLTFSSYCLGWISGTYREFKLIMHTGGILTHSSRIYLYPGVRAGIFMEVNGPNDDNTAVFDFIQFYVSDLLLGLPPSVNATTACHLNVPLNNPSPPADPNATTLAGVIKASNNSTKCTGYCEPLDRDLYLGIYSNIVYGDATVHGLNAYPNQMTLVFGRYGWFNLTALSKESFSSTMLGPVSYMNRVTTYSFEFKFDDKNRTTSLVFQQFPGVTFEKVLPKPTSSSNHIHGMPCHILYFEILLCFVIAITRVL